MRGPRHARQAESEAWSFAASGKSVYSYLNPSYATQAQFQQWQMCLEQRAERGEHQSGGAWPGMAVTVVHAVAGCVRYTL